MIRNNGIMVTCAGIIMVASSTILPPPIPAPMYSESLLTPIPVSDISRMVSMTPLTYNRAYLEALSYEAATWVQVYAGIPIFPLR